MTRRTLFICYSRQDKELFDKLLTHLDPIERQDRLELWTDEKLQAGDDWEPGIYAAIDRAHVAVVLVSPDLLASDFVYDKELPRLKAAREERGLTLLPFYLRPVAIELLPEWLPKIQGLNQPNEPLGDQPLRRQDEELARISAEILRHFDDKPKHKDVPRREFTAKLALRNGHLVRSYGRPPYYDLHVSRDSVDLKRLAKLSHDKLGRQLFELLLGSEKDRNTVLSAAYQREIRDPLRHAFRVRIRTDDDALRELPWTWCRWRDYSLVEKGWTFELAASDEPRPIEHLHTPCRALLIGTELDGLPRLAADAYGKGLESLLAHAWGQPLKAHLLHRARTRDELESELANPVHLVQVYAHAQESGNELEILLGDGQGGVAPLPFSDLVALLASRPPRVLVLDTVGECPTAPPIEGVAVMLHLRHSSRDTRAAANWWSDVLVAGRHPEQAFCSLPSDVRRRSALNTDFHEWRIDHSDHVPKVDRPRAHLDRRDQRRVVLEAVEELVRKAKRRVTCVVAYGAEGNLVNHFPVQMIATLKERAARLASIRRFRIDLPPERDGLGRQQIYDQFREIFQLQPSDPMTAAFPARRVGPRAKPVYFLDWGTYGRGHQTPLLSGHLEAWVAFCRDELENACPPGARILSYLGLVSAAERHAKLAELVETLHRQYHQSHFDLVALPTLGIVGPDDLLRFLSDPANSSCPEIFHGNFPDRIVEETGGSFEATVKLLEETERDNRWWELDEELPKVNIRIEIDQEIVL